MAEVWKDFTQLKDLRKKQDFSPTVSHPYLQNRQHDPSATGLHRDLTNGGRGQSPIRPSSLNNVRHFFLPETIPNLHRLHFGAD